ncbi:TonB-dependent receptor [Parahaliea sp. F7430]|uniref:TonB-dependent receptor n=1 Tax=Sediminihaliea albiluteola TaxID=2758564 RepID=A0A7W2TTX4_9GAMM|nr:TonB-dependent receptor [Sediminihaliea albiluteola]MBA6411790.1 TonB-dependent receptor [Sediminihaliea albiluteola]
MTPALAQAQALEEIVVTAQKREQSLQDTPIAITAFGTDDLQNMSIDDLGDLATFAPNVMISPAPTNTGKAVVAIRGSVTSNPAITWEPTVGLYLDGVYVGKFSGNVMNISELERVEVLRGPQGTLYGKNTISGAINFITVQPSGEFGGSLRAGAGNYDYREIAGSLDTATLSLGDLGQLMAKISGGIERRDPLYDNVNARQGPVIHPLFGTEIQPNPPGNSGHNELDKASARLDVLWDATERLALRYTLNYAEADNTPGKAQLTAIDPTDTTFGFPLPAGIEKYLSDEDDNLSKSSTDAPEYEKFDSTSHSFFATYNLGEVGSLGEVVVNYIFNTRELDFRQTLDNDGTPFSLFHSIDQKEIYEQLSHEIQLTGATERTDWVLGLYYFDEEADVLDPLAPFNEVLEPLLGAPILLENQYGFSAEQLAVYGQLEWRPPILDDRLSTTLGLRWTREKKDAYVIHPGDFSVSANDKWTNVAPTFIVTYDIATDINAYAKYSRGWKAGGFNGESNDPVAFSQGYDPQEVDAIELGIKSRWLDGALQLNAAAFYNDETDLQLSVFTSGAGASSEVRNAGEATKRGFELELAYQVNADLLLSANYGYLDVEYKEFKEFDPVIGAVVDKSGEKDIQYAPENTLNLSIDYTFARGHWGELRGYMNYSYVDDYVPYVNPSQNASSAIDSRGLLNARLTLAEIPLSNATLELALWGKNLSDEEYRLNTVPFGTWTASYFGDPRTYGVQANISF